MVERWQLVETAYHEAGHAVASVELDLPFTEAVLEQDGSGHVGPGVRLPRHWGHHFSAHGRERAEAQIVMIAAGSIAQARLTGRTTDVPTGKLFSPPDWRKVKSHYEALRPTTRLERLIDESRGLVERRWRDIEFVATALVEHGTLTAEDVREQIDLAHIAGTDARSPDRTRRP